jgi:sulfite oxidase
MNPTPYRAAAKAAGSLLFRRSSGFRAASSANNNYNNDNNNEAGNGKTQMAYATAAGAAVAATIGFVVLNKSENKQISLQAKSEMPTVSLAEYLSKIDKAKSVNVAGDRVEGLPEFTNNDVRKHGTKETGIWMTYRNGVYDVSEFIPKHPGAQNIMLAAGGDVEPFWKIFALHFNNPQVNVLIEQCRIGNLTKADVAANVEASSSAADPFANEPKRDTRLAVQSLTPFNAETPFSVLADNFFTPNHLFYVRSHLPTPDVDIAEYELEVGGVGVKNDKMLKLEDIKKFPKYTVTAAIQCGGNRRSEMHAEKAVKGLEWFGGAIGNAKWSGARLSDVLKAAGMGENDDETLKGKGGKELHVICEGCDLSADGSAFGASIPLSRALDPRRDVLLAYEMNGEPLPRDHGFPIRLIVPGTVGVRNVKWVQRIIVANEECQSHWQQHDYKSFHPSITWDTVDWSKSSAVHDLPVTSAICNPKTGSTVKLGWSGKLEVKGYAWSGQGNRIARVDLTTDRGKTWFEAELTQEASIEPRHYGWTLWKASIAVPKGTKELEVWSKAVDSSCNVQPENWRDIWNLRGLASNAYYRAKFNVVT